MRAPSGLRGTLGWSPGAGTIDIVIPAGPVVHRKAETQDRVVYHVYVEFRAKQLRIALAPESKLEKRSPHEFVIVRTLIVRRLARRHTHDVRQVVNGDGAVNTTRRLGNTAHEQQ